LIDDGEEVALIFSVDEKAQVPVSINAFSVLQSIPGTVPAETRERRYTEDIARHFISAAFLSEIPNVNNIDPESKSLLSTYVSMRADESKGNDKFSATTTTATNDDAQEVPAFVSQKKKYKPVAQKVRPVARELPTEFRIVRNITGDPLANMPQLNPHPPAFTPTGRYTKERMEKVDAIHEGEFLWPEERRLMHHFMMKNEGAFAWEDDERGRFKPEYFPPVEIPTIGHTPWVQRNIPIPPGIYEEVCEIIRSKISSGVYEPSNSSYRSRWFCVLKKDGRHLRIVHSLEPLNAVTIQHSGVTPIPEHLAENFACRSCGAMLDLFVGYDERLLSEKSRDLTTFQTPFGAMRLVTLPMGWTNSVPIFHDDVTYILQPEIPEHTIPYIDDVPVKGPASRYEVAPGVFETIRENCGIRRFVWEHFINLGRIVQRMKYAGGTFSGKKLVLCADEIVVVGHVCMYEGRKADRSRVAAVKDWGPCKTLTEVRAFLGTIGVCRIFIKNFSHRAYPLTALTKKDAPFVFGPEQIAAQEDLKKALITSPALRPINYSSTAPVVLAVDTSQLAIGTHLCQCDEKNPRLRYFNRFESIVLNDREMRFSQAKLEIYGLFRALRKLKMYLIGVRNFVVEVDAKYIKGMLKNPDIAPSASVNRWILAILTFHFNLVHVPGERHGPDGLSRRPRQPDDEEVDEDLATEEFDDWIDHLYGFIHLINEPPLAARRKIKKRRIAAFPKKTAASVYTNAFVKPIEQISYDVIPRTPGAQQEDEKLVAVIKFHEDLQRPDGMNDAEYQSFVKYCMKFFVEKDKLWRRHPQGAHKLVVPRERRLQILNDCHNDIGHKGFYATRSTVLERFWWPHIYEDVQWFVKTCHYCQERQIKQIKIPPVVAMPAPIFAKAYIDTMRMAPSGGYKYIVQARCSLTHYPEYRALRTETAKTLGEWIFEDILCRWGALSDIVTDNGAAFVKALNYLSKKYKINYIRISGYNSRANGIVERPHFDVRQSLLKATEGEETKWAAALHSVFWAERITVKRRLGVSPYFAITGTHPILPLDIIEATYLSPPPESILTSTDLIARRAIELQKRREQVQRLHEKVYVTRVKAARRFEQENKATIKDFNFKRGDLVLMRNTAIEKSLDRKMHARYLGPLVVVDRNKGGAYIVCELDGSVFDRPVAAFRVIPYFARTSIELPEEALDVERARLQQMREEASLGDDEDDEDKEQKDVGEEEPESEGEESDDDE